MPCRWPTVQHGIFTIERGYIKPFLCGKIELLRNAVERHATDGEIAEDSAFERGGVVLVKPHHTLVVSKEHHAIIYDHATALLTGREPQLSSHRQILRARSTSREGRVARIDIELINAINCRPIYEPIGNIAAIKALLFSGLRILSKGLRLANLL